MTLNDLETNSSERLTSRASFWHYLYNFDKVLNLFFLRCLTFVDLEWPRDKLFWKSFAKSFILRYNLCIFNQFWNLTFLTFYWDFWPLMTFNDLETNFFENFTPRASFWGIIWLFSSKFEIWPFRPFFVNFDLEWPLMTLKTVFTKRWCQELHFDV